MNLRKNKRVDYKQLHNGFKNEKQIHKPKKQTTVAKNKTILAELKCLNYLIVKDLKCSSTKPPFAKGKMDISAKLRMYLEAAYGITHRHTNATQLLEDHTFNVERFYNHTDYSSIFQNSFCLRIQKPKTIRFFTSHNLEEKQIQYKNVLHYSFTVSANKLSV